MSSGAPRISVGMPVYNGEPYIESAVRSVLEQTFGDFELWISDNASTDRTEEICRDLASSDSRISYVRNDENIGASANYNRLVELARGEYFRWANADDLSQPTLHEKCLATLEGNPDAVLAYGKTKLIDMEGEVYADYDDNLDLRQERPSERFIAFLTNVGLTNVIYGLMRTEAVRKTARMGDGSYPAADINFMAELTLNGKFIEIPDQLFFRRMHPAASSWDRADDEVQKGFWTGKGQSAFTLPTWRSLMSHVASARKAPISVREKKCVLLHLLKRGYWKKWDLLEDVVYLVRRPFVRLICIVETFRT